MQGEIRIPLNNFGDVGYITANDLKNVEHMKHVMPDRDCNITIPAGDYGNFHTWNPLVIQSYVTEWTTEPNPVNGRPELVIRFKVPE